MEDTAAPKIVEAGFDREDETITMVSSDNVQYKSTVSAMKMSETIKQLIEDAGIDNPIPLPNVAAEELEKVITFCQHHYTDPVSVTSVDNDNNNNNKNQSSDPNEDCLHADDICEWDVEFIKFTDINEVFRMILASNYLDIKALLDLSCKTVANQIKGKTPEEIRVTFDIQDDFTPEEEERVRKENEWCEAK